MDFTVQSRNEAYKNNAKTVQKFTSHPPEYATVANIGSHPTLEPTLI